MISIKAINNMNSGANNAKSDGTTLLLTTFLLKLSGRSMSKHGTGRWMTVHMERKIAVRQLHRISIVPRPQSAVTKPRTRVESVKFWIARVDTITGEVPKWLKPYITDTMAIGT